MFVSTESNLGVIITPPYTLLLVEDNESLGTAMTNLLRLSGYRVLQAHNAEEAFELSRSFEDRIDLLLTDVVLPKVNGMDLAGLLCVQRPEMQVLFMSGYREEELHRNGLLAPGFAFIQKPVSIESVVAKLQFMLTGRRKRLKRA